MRILLLSIILTISTFIYAQDFEVAPVLVNFRAEPGSVEKTILTIKNYANIKQKYSLKLSDYIINENGAKKGVAAGSTEKSIANWINISPSVVILNPNETTEVELIITVPKQHYETRWGMIHIKVDNEKLASDIDNENMATGVLLVPRIVVLVKQSPRSNINYSAKLTNFKQVEIVLDSNNMDRSVYEVTIVNTGDKVIDAKISLSVADIQTAEEERFPSKRYTVYPGQTRVVQLQLDKKFIKGKKYALAAVMDYGHRKSLEGAQLIIEP